MGFSTKPIAFWSDEIKLDVHTASRAEWIRKITLRQITRGQKASLYEIDNGDYEIRLWQSNDFAVGKPV